MRLEPSPTVQGFVFRPGEIGFSTLAGNSLTGMDRQDAGFYGLLDLCNTTRSVEGRPDSENFKGSTQLTRPKLK